MRILVLGNNYSPERTGVAPFTTALCEHLAARGHLVTVITARPCSPEWKVWDGYHGFIYRKELLNGVSVRRIWHFVPSRASNLVQRLAHDVSFTVGAFLAGLFAGKFDMIYCCCPPPILGFTAYVLGKIHRKPYIMKLADLASDAALATGILTNGWLVQVARGLESIVYRKAEKVVCLCQPFVDKLVSRGISPEKLCLISDWADTQLVYPVAGTNEFRKTNQFTEQQFVVMHTGNMGKKQDLMNVVRAAELSQGMRDVVWLLVGNGEEYALIVEEVRRRQLENIKLLPLQPVESLAKMYSAADVLLLNQKAAVVDSVIPSKLLTYMAAGRVVLAAASDKSEAARLIRASLCGLLVPAEDPKALVEAVKSLQGDLASRLKLGMNGRAYADQHFTKHKVLEAYDRLFSRYANELRAETRVPKKTLVAR